MESDLLEVSRIENDMEYGLIMKKKGNGTVKKLVKIVMGVITSIFIIIIVFWGRFIYVSDYKITKVDTSVSPDGTYELVLKAIGEAD